MESLHKMFLKKNLIKFLLFLVLFLPCGATFAKETINIAFTIDKNYPVFTLLAINSILKNNHSNSDYHFYIVESNLSKRQMKFMTDYIEKRGQNVSFIDVDTEILDKGIDIFQTRQWLGRINSISLARILLGDLLPKDVEKVLYLDGDILVLRDLKILYETPFDGKVAVMAKDGSLPKYSFYEFEAPYFNSGMILMNLNVWREQQISKNLLAYLNNNMDLFIPKESSSDYYNYPDQDLINYCLKGKIKEISDIWNYAHMLGEYHEAIGIVHFLSQYKPWVYFDRIKYPLYNIYYKNWDESGLRIYKYYHKYFKRFGYLFKEYRANFKNNFINSYADIVFAFEYFRDMLFYKD